MKGPALICFAASTVFADSCSDCCLCTDPLAEKEYCGEFSLGGNWLYVRPDISSVEFARVIHEVEANPEIDSGERKCLKTKFDQGYEFFASYRSAVCNCTAWDVRGAFLSQDFSHTTSVTTTTPSIVPLMGFTFSTSDLFCLSAEGKLSLDLSELHGELGWNYIPSCSTFIRAFAGVAYTNLKQNIDLFYTDPVEEVELLELSLAQMSKFSGLGPRVGFFANWSFCDELALFGELSGSILFAKTSGSYSQISNVLPAQALRANETFCHGKRTIPVLDLKVGLSVKFASTLTFPRPLRGSKEGGIFRHFARDSMFVIVQSRSKRLGMPLRDCPQTMPSIFGVFLPSLTLPSSAMCLHMASSGKRSRSCESASKKLSNF